MADPVPQVVYTSKDYAGFRQLLIDAISSRAPDWTSRSPNDFGMVLIELFSYIGDILSYYGDRIANEAFLSTATQRESVFDIARMLDYEPTNSVAATVTLQFTVADGSSSVTIPARTKVSTASVAAVAAGAKPVIFETDVDLTIGRPGTNTGTVDATEGETILTESIGTSTGVVDQRYRLFRTPVIGGSVKVHVDGSQWTYITHLLDANTNDAVFDLETDENGVVWVIFGDNVNGRIPAQGAPITADYRIGGGVRGNVAASTVRELLTTPIDPNTGLTVPVTNVTNPLAATGGADAESLDSIRKSAPRSLTALNRAVTLKDYSNLALKVARVAKANATSSVPTSVTLYIAPPDATTTTAQTKTDVQTYLADKKQATTTVTVLDPIYIGMNITVNPLNVKENYLRESVKREVEKELKGMLAFENVDFAKRISVGDTHKAIANVDGVDYAVVTLHVRTDDANQTTKVGDAVYAANEIPKVGTVTITATGGIT